MDSPVEDLKNPKCVVLVEGNFEIMILHLEVGAVGDHRELETECNERCRKRLLRIALVVAAVTCLAVQNLAGSLFIFDEISHRTLVVAKHRFHFRFNF